MAQLERRRLNDEQPGQLLKQPEQTEQKTATQEVTSPFLDDSNYKPLQVVAPPTAPKVPDNLKTKKAERKAQSQVTPDEGFYTKLFKEQNERIKPLTDKELEQQAKKRKREKIFAAIGDGISALSNLYFTTQYAPNVEQKPMSDKIKERWDKLEAERKGNEKAWYEGYVNALRLDDAKAAQLRKEKADEKAYDLRIKEYQRQVAKDEVNASNAQLQADLIREKKAYQKHLNRMAELEKEYMERNDQKMPTTKVGGGSSSGGGRSKATTKWTAYNPNTGDVIEFDASSESNAWSKVPDGYIIRQKPAETKDTKVTNIATGAKTTTTTRDTNTSGPKSNATNKSNESNGAQDYVPGAINGVKRTKYVPKNKR